MLSILTNMTITIIMLGLIYDYYILHEVYIFSALISFWPKFVIKQYSILPQLHIFLMSDNDI